MPHHSLSGFHGCHARDLRGQQFPDLIGFGPKKPRKCSTVCRRRTSIIYALRVIGGLGAILLGHISGFKQAVNCPSPGFQRDGSVAKVNLSP